MKRRFFLLAAPAIVAAPSLMRVSAAILDSLPPIFINEDVSYPGRLNGLITMTLRNRSHLLAENVMKNNALLLRLKTDRVFPLLSSNGIIHCDNPFRGA